MATKRNSRKSRTIGPAVLGKPKGVIQARVQKVGPEHFGIVAVDCAKARSKWMLCDFYGKVLIPPTVVEHHRVGLELAAIQLREAIERHGLLDHLVAVEMTGTYHRPVQRAFRKAGSETRLVHPFASRHYRLPAHADSKTDDHDLEGIFRATVIHCRIANRATRTVFQMVSGRRLYHHPSRLDRQYVLEKLRIFHQEHGTAPLEILRDLREAVAQIPEPERAAEAGPLQEACRKARRSRRPGPQAIGEILLVVLAKLGFGQVQSQVKAPSPDTNLSGTGPR